MVKQYNLKEKMKIEEKLWKKNSNIDTSKRMLQKR